MEAKIKEICREERSIESNSGWVATIKPAINKRESPGKNNPKINPFSMKMMKMRIIIIIIMKIKIIIISL
jgi:hypothetical protein